MISKNKNYTRLERYKIFISEDEFFEYPKNEWRTCRDLILKKHKKDFANSRYGFEIKSKPGGMVEICVTSEKLNIIRAV